jgi:hypothetical protein
VQVVISVLMVIAVAACGSLQAALKSSLALSSAGYQNVNVDIQTGSGIVRGGLINVSYTSGPAGLSPLATARRAEHIVWDTFPERFGQVAIYETSGGCTGPVCTSQSNELSSASYQQLLAEFGPRPHSLVIGGSAGANVVPRWVIWLAIGLAVAVLAAAALVLTLVLRGRRPAPPRTS